MQSRAAVRLLRRRPLQAILFQEAAPRGVFRPMLPLPQSAFCHFLSLASQDIQLSVAVKARRLSPAALRLISGAVYRAAPASWSRRLLIQFIQSLDQVLRAA